MSWIDKIQTDYAITTGDGKRYAPQWLNASKNIEYNVATFEFKDTEGTLVYRGTPKGARYAIELYFQGDDHLEVSADFEKSAANPAAWIIEHPMYGRLRVQPVSLIFENALYNVTKITGGVIETITDAPDVPVVSAPDKIVADAQDCNDALAESYANEVPSPGAATVRDVITRVGGVYDAALGSIRDSVAAQAFTNSFNAANAAIGDAFTRTSSAITAIQDFVSLPAALAETAISRVEILANMLLYLGGTVPGLSDKATKKLYETIGGTLLSSMIVAAVTNIIGSYTRKSSVLGVVQTVLNNYNAYLANLDLMQSLNAGGPLAYMPGANGITKLGALMSYGVSTLLDIAASSRQERSFYLEEDSNIIMLAARVLGTASDENIDALLQSSEVGLNEILGMKKGRKITYYV